MEGYLVKFNRQNCRQGIDKPKTAERTKHIASTSIDEGFRCRVASSEALSVCTFWRPQVLQDRLLTGKASDKVMHTYGMTQMRPWRKKGPDKAQYTPTSTNKPQEDFHRALVDKATESKEHPAWPSGVGELPGPFEGGKPLCALCRRWWRKQLPASSAAASTSSSSAKATQPAPQQKPK